MIDRFIIIADSSHFRIYQEPTGPDQPALRNISAVDFPAGKHHYTDRETAPAGRFPGSKGSPQGMSIDERLPMQEEEERRVVRFIAEQINHFLFDHPSAEWRFAAPPSLENQILAHIEPRVRERLLGALAKDLVNIPPQEVYAHFDRTTL